MARNYRKTNPLVHYGILGMIYVVGILTLAGHTALHAITQPEHQHDIKTSAHKKDHCHDAPGRSHLITFTSNGASPSSLRLARCDEVVVINSLDRKMITALGPHAHHVTYPGFAETSLAPGETYRFQAALVGTYPLHDHDDDSLVTTLIIE